MMPEDRRFEDQFRKDLDLLFSKIDGLKDDVRKIDSRLEIHIASLQSHERTDVLVAERVAKLEEKLSNTQIRGLLLLVGALLSGGAGGAIGHKLLEAILR